MLYNLTESRSYIFRADCFFERLPVMLSFAANMMFLLQVSYIFVPLVSSNPTGTSFDGGCMSVSEHLKWFQAD